MGYNAWDVFRRAPSRVGRGRQAAVDFAVYFGWGADFIVIFFVFVFFFLRTHTAYCKYEAALPNFISTLGLIARAVRGRDPQTWDLWKRASVVERVERVSSHAVSRWSRSAGCCAFRGVFWVRRDVVLCLFVFFSSNAHGLLQV